MNVRVAGLLVALCVTASTGCSSLPSAEDALFGAGNPAAVAPPQLDMPSYMVVFRPEGGDPKRLRLPHREGMFVADVMTQSGVLKEFRRVKIQIWRPQPGGDYHKLDVEFEKSKRVIPVAANYAVHPDDLVVFFEDTSTVFDDMLESLPIMGNDRQAPSW